MGRLRRSPHAHRCERCRPVSRHQIHLEYRLRPIIRMLSRCLLCRRRRNQKVTKRRRVRNRELVFRTRRTEYNTCAQFYCLSDSLSYFCSSFYFASFIVPFVVPTLYYYFYLICRFHMYFVASCNNTIASRKIRIVHGSHIFLSPLSRNIPLVYLKCPLYLKCQI